MRVIAPIWPGPAALWCLRCVRRLWLPFEENTMSSMWARTLIRHRSRWFIGKYARKLAIRAFAFLVEALITLLCLRGGMPWVSFLRLLGY